MTSSKFISSVASRVGNFMAGKLGRCGKCMRDSFAGALASWAGFVAVTHFAASNDCVRVLLLSCALVSSSLWILHVVTFAARSVANYPQAGSALRESESSLTRRQTVRLFGAATTFAATLSFMSVWQWAVAQEQCIPSGLPCTCLGLPCCEDDDECGGSFPNTRCDFQETTCK